MIIPNVTLAVITIIIIIIPVIGKNEIIASGILFNTIDHEASATYCNASKKTANTEIPKKK